jgi:hypothetical protein
VSLSQGDWIMAGFDLAALGCAAVAALCAVKVRRSAATATARRKPRTATAVEAVPS